MTRYASELRNTDSIPQAALHQFVKAGQEEVQRRRGAELAFCRQRQKLREDYNKNVEALVGGEVLQRLTELPQQGAPDCVPQPRADLAPGDLGVDSESFEALQRDYHRQLAALHSGYQAGMVRVSTRPTWRPTSRHWEYVSPPYDGGDAQAYPDQRPYTTTYAFCHPDSGEIRHRVRVRTKWWEDTGFAETWVYKTVKLAGHGDKLSVRAWLVPHRVEQVAGVFRDALLFYSADVEQDFYAELGVQNITPQITPQMWARTAVKGYGVNTVSLSWSPRRQRRCDGFYLLEHPLDPSQSMPTETAEFFGQWRPHDEVVIFAKFVSRNQAGSHLARAHSLMWHEHEIAGMDYRLERDV
jgi:hypothetical protein